MKKIIIHLCLAVGLGTAFTGCSDFLDSDYLFDKKISIEKVFADKNYTNEWLAYAYEFLNNNEMQQVCSKKTIAFNFADDMYYGDSDYSGWRCGTYTETGNKINLNIWENAYKAIRQVSIFLNNVDMNKELSEADIIDMKGQEHFLRAYFYWILVRTFGPVPIVPDETLDYTKEYDEISLLRNSYDECVDYIVGECVKAATMLQDRRDLQEIVRPTRGAALALRSRVLLYAASPLFNGKAPQEVITALVDKNGRQLLPSTYDESKWAKAAAAAKDVMELKRYQLYVSYKRDYSSLAYPATITPPDDNGTFHLNEWPNGWENIDPFDSYRSLFDGTVSIYNNPELIFSRGKNQGSEDIEVMVIHQLPRSQGGGYNCHGMTQKQCDAYYMNDGSDCPGMNKNYAGQDGYTDPRRYDADDYLTDIVQASELNNYPELGSKGAGVCKQYAQREPRFYASVGYNGSVWHMLNADPEQKEEKDVQIFYYRDEQDGYKPGTYWLNTGIGVKKYVNPYDISDVDKSYDQSRIVAKAAPDIRYAEILLNYAEALNELTTSYEMPSWDGTKVYSIARTEEELKKGIQPVRIRAGLPDYDVYGDPDKFRIKLKRERQIEFFAEGHRYWDLRRWCDAPIEESLPVYGCNIYATKSSAAAFHTPVETPSLKSSFSTKMWFYPIHYYIMKRNVLMTQNPGWTNPE